MTDYQKMYTMLFNAITDALIQMEKQNYGSAKETLISAQQRAEELYLSAEDESGRPRCLASEKATTLAVVFFYGNFAMLLFESCDAVLDHLLQLTVFGATLVFGDISKLLQQYRIGAQGVTTF